MQDSDGVRRAQPPAATVFIRIFVRPVQFGPSRTILRSLCFIYRGDERLSRRALLVTFFERAIENDSYQQIDTQAA
jgi:hypothetical protein